MNLSFKVGNVCFFILRKLQGTYGYNFFKKNDPQSIGVKVSIRCIFQIIILYLRTKGIIQEGFSVKEKILFSLITHVIPTRIMLNLREYLDQELESI